MNKKLKLLNLLLIILLLVFQYMVILDGQKALPSEEWSRSFSSNTSSRNYVKMQSVPTESGFAISLLDFKKMDVLDCSPDMDCSVKWSYSKLNPYKNTWSDGETSYFIQDDTLIRSINGKENTEISLNVENFTKTDESLVYWRTNHEVVIQQGDNQPFSFTTEFPVYTSIIVDEQVFVITKISKEDNQFVIHNGTNENRKLFSFKLLPTENLVSMQISVDGQPEQFSIILDLLKNSGGSRTKLIRNASFDLSENQKPIFTNLEFIDELSGNILTDVSYPYLYEGEEGTKIAFSASMNSQKGKTNKVFSGNYDSSLIEASAVTKKGDYFVQPIFLNDQTISFLKLDGKEKSLMYSSSNDEKRLQSGETQKGDYKEAFYNLVSLLFNGLGLLLLSFTWLIPSLGISYMTLAILQKFHKSFAHPLALYVNTLALFFCQFLLFSNFFHPERVTSYSPYLTEVWHVYLVIFIAGIGCLLPVFLSRTKITEDNFNQIILYTSLMNLLILLIILGPYFI